MSDVFSLNIWVQWETVGSEVPLNWNLTDACLTPWVKLDTKLSMQISTTTTNEWVVQVNIMVLNFFKRQIMYNLHTLRFGWLWWVKENTSLFTFVLLKIDNRILGKFYAFLMTKALSYIVHFLYVFFCPYYLTPYIRV